MLPSALYYTSLTTGKFIFILIALLGEHLVIAILGALDAVQRIAAVDEHPVLHFKSHVRGEEALAHARRGSHLLD